MAALDRAMASGDRVLAETATGSFRRCFSSARGHVANMPAAPRAERLRLLAELEIEVEHALHRAQSTGIVGARASIGSTSARGRAPSLQLRAAGAPIAREDPHAIAARGVASAASELPHAAAIQRAFGRHDVSDIRVQVGGEAEAASRELGARAYATGTLIAFAAPPDLHTAAHEAAHVVQQRAGIYLDGGIGAVGDRYEQHADRVADAVVRGESADALLDELPGGAAARPQVQRKTNGPDGESPASPIVCAPDILRFHAVEVGSVSEPLTTTFANRARRTATIESLEIVPSRREELRALPSEFELLARPGAKVLAPGQSVVLEVDYRPARLVRAVKAHLRATGRLGTTPFTAEAWLLGRSIEPRPENKQQRELALARRASVDLAAGSAAPPTRTYGEMLAALLAAQRLVAHTDAASERRAQALLGAVRDRLDALRSERHRLRRFGAGNHAGTFVFDMAEGAVIEWTRKLALGARIDTDAAVTRFRAGSEVLRFLTGEEADAPDLRGYDRRTRQFAIGAAIVTLAPGALASLLASAPALASVATQEASLLAYGARLLAPRVTVWALHNPVAALVVAESLLGLGIQLGEQGIGTFAAQVNDPLGALLLVGHLLIDVMQYRLARGGSGGSRSQSGGERTPAPRSPDDPVISEVQRRAAKLREVISNLAQQSSAEPATRPTAQGTSFKAPAKIQPAEPEKARAARSIDASQDRGGAPSRSEPAGQVRNSARGNGAWETSARPGEAPTPETISHGTVRMEDHPAFKATLAEATSLGFTVVNGAHARVSNIHVVNSNGVLIEVRRHLHVIPGMRYLDLEHEIGHIRQLLRFGSSPPPKAKLVQLPNGTEVKAEGNLASGVLTTKMDAIVEYHNRLDEYVRLATRGAPRPLLDEHAAGLSVWKLAAESAGLGYEKASVHAWAKQYFPEIPSLEVKCRQSGAALQPKTKRW